jgi:uncharacterized MAPEG superfamily protein
MDASMPSELKLLGAAAALGLVQLTAAFVAGIGQDRSLGWLMGPRDQPRAPGVLAQRLERAFGNFMQTFPLFAAALLACAAAGRLGPLTAQGSMLYLAARIIYLPLYAVGAPVVRTLAWAASVAGVVMALAALLR